MKYQISNLNLIFHDDYLVGFCRYAVNARLHTTMAMAEALSRRGTEKMAKNDKLLLLLSVLNVNFSRLDIIFFEFIEYKYVENK